MPNNNINGIHAQRLRDIRPYINFDFDLRKPLTNYQKRKIKIYWDEIDQLNARPAYAFRPRRRDHLKTAQEFAQHTKQLSGLTVAFIPMPNPNKPPHIRFNKNGELFAETDHVTTRYIALDKFELIRDPVNHVNHAISRDHLARAFTILAGKYEIPNSYSRNSVGGAVGRLTAKYCDENKNNYFGNWLHGLNAHHYFNQANFELYQRDKYAAKVKKKSDRRNKKRRSIRKPKK